MGCRHPVLQPRPLQVTRPGQWSPWAVVTLLYSRGLYRSPGDQEAGTGPSSGAAPIPRASESQAPLHEDRGPWKGTGSQPRSGQQADGIAARGRNFLKREMWMGRVTRSSPSGVTAQTARLLGLPGWVPSPLASLWSLTKDAGRRVNLPVFPESAGKCWAVRHRERCTCQRLWTAGWQLLRKLDTSTP